mmetsp:Transcript_42442/g.117469  ORF Transcript_42442/g.117469 Transcript_42442/m.117469 type:complete len:343 (-) Transcript_42442:655-1683(-)
MQGTRGRPRRLPNFAASKDQAHRWAPGTLPPCTKKRKGPKSTLSPGSGQHFWSVMPASSEAAKWPGRATRAVAGVSSEGREASRAVRGAKWRAGAACEPSRRPADQRAERSRLLLPLLVYALEHPLRLALRKVLQVVVVWRQLDEPLALDVGHLPDVVLRREHKLVVEAPLGLVLQDRRRVQRDDLVVLDGQVVAGALEVGDLHEEAGQQALADVGVVLLRVEVGALELEAVAVHDAHQLRAHRVRRLHRAVVDEIVVAPRRRLLVVLPRMVHVEQRQVVAVDVLEARLGLVRSARRLARPHERVGRVEHGRQREHLVGARELRRVEEHLGQLRVERELGHH